MAKIQYVEVNDFMQMLKDNSLIIVSAAEFEMNSALRRSRLLKKKSLSLTEIIDAKFLPVKTNKSLIDWTLSGKIKPTEFYQEKSGLKRIMILTAALKRLGCND
jgi:hypothetical protein